MLDDSAISGIANAIAEAQIARIVSGVRHVRDGWPTLDRAIVTGLGDFIAAEAAAARGTGSDRAQRSSRSSGTNGPGCRGGVAPGGECAESDGVTDRRRLVVIKIGGGLSAIPGALESTCAAVAESGRRTSIVVVPGGGPFADAVRAFDLEHRISPDAAHWMAMLAMDQYAHVLTEGIEGAVLVEEAGAVVAAVDPVGVAVLAPSRWMRAADVLPHTWDATSDSVAAFVAGALDAEQLILVKPSTCRKRSGGPLLLESTPRRIALHPVALEPRSRPARTAQGLRLTSALTPLSGGAPILGRSTCHR